MPHTETCVRTVPVSPPVICTGHGTTSPIINIATVTWHHVTWWLLIKWHSVGWSSFQQERCRNQSRVTRLQSSSHSKLFLSPSWHKTHEACKTNFNYSEAGGELRAVFLCHTVGRDRDHPDCRFCFPRVTLEYIQMSQRRLFLCPRPEYSRHNGLVTNWQ